MLRHVYFSTRWRRGAGSVKHGHVNRAGCCDHFCRCLQSEADHRCPCRQLEPARLLSYLETINKSPVIENVFFPFFLSSSSSSASTYVVFSMASRPGFSDYTTSTMGCIVVGVVALRPRKTSSIVSHVKLNRTSRGVPGSRFHRSSHKLERNNRARAKVKPPPPEFSQGCSITGSGRRLTICPDSQIPQ